MPSNSKAPAALPFAEELTLYLVHGYLHLAGLDDVDPADRRKCASPNAGPWII